MKNWKKVLGFGFLAAAAGFFGTWAASYPMERVGLEMQEAWKSYQRVRYERDEIKVPAYDTKTIKSMISLLQG